MNKALGHCRNLDGNGGSLFKRNVSVVDQAPTFRCSGLQTKVVKCFESGLVRQSSEYAGSKWKCTTETVFWLPEGEEEAKVKSKVESKVDAKFVITCWDVVRDILPSRAPRL